MKLWDRTLDTLGSLVDRVTARVDYFALYAAEVVAQSGDLLTLDVQPEHPRLPGMQDIPIKTGVPGVTAQVGTGSRVLVGWENGDPRKPYVSLWQNESVAKLNITCSGDISINGSTSAVVRDGDHITITGSGSADGMVSITPPKSSLKA